MDLIATLARVLAEHEATPAVRHLHTRVRDLGADALDEVEQFRQLQKACRELPALNDALVAAGLPDVAKAAIHPVVPEVGAVVQAFNRVVEEVWSRRSRLPPAR